MMPHHLSLCNLAGMLSRGLQEAEEPRPHLTTLPDPLLRQITYLLDRQTTIALASTCLPVRDPAECSAWKDLNISVQRVLIPGPTRYDDSRPLGGNRLHTIHHMAIFGKNMSGGEGAASPRGAMDRYIRSLCVLLEGHTSWLKSVKAIYLDVDWLLSFETARLLSLVSGTLTWLELIPHIIYTPANPGPKPCCTLRNLFGGLDSKLKNLRHLQLPLDENWASTVVAVLEKTPNLRSLCLIPADAYSGGWGEPMRYNEPPKDAVWPLLPLLCKLEVNEMNIVLVPMLIAIIKSARSLEHVRTRGPIRCWLPVKGDELISELGNLKKLNYLGVSAECKEAIIATKAFSSLEQLSMVHDQTPWDAPQLEFVTIPPMPQIKTFYSHTHAAGVGRTIAYPCFSEPFSCGLPAPIRNFSPTILAQLHAASSLETIQYPEEVENEWCGEDDAYWGSRACSEKRGRVTLIRTYTFSNEVFTHCRSYAAHHSSINGGFTHRIEDMWEEHTDYAGLHVPADILSSVCTAAGLNVAWLKPGRGLTMPTEAWKVLRMWKVINKQDLPNSEEEVPEEMLVPAKSIEGEC